MSQSDPTSAGRVLRAGRPLVRLGIDAWLLLGIAGAVALLLWLVLQLRIVVFPLVLAMFPAAILLPLVDWLERRRWPRTVASLAVETVFLLAVAGVLALLALQIRGQLTDVVDELRRQTEQLRSLASNLPGLGSLSPRELLQGGGGGGGQPGQAAVEALRGLTVFTAELFLGIVALFFYLRDDDRIARRLKTLFPGSWRPHAVAIGERAWGTIAGYIRGQSMIAVVDGTLVAVGLAIQGVPLWAPLGVIVFLGAFVPTVGSIVAGAVAVLVALVTKGVVGALITLAIVVGVQQLEGHVLAPIVLGRTLGIHPLAVLAAILLGAKLLGPFGAIVAAPLAASAYKAAGYLREQTTGASDAPSARA